ncbi:acetolactate synthase [Thelonectria olida]|uniref:Acetolactate synthase n=1 Tax=Thelonectria olida TaxID=1576542 RepID=A0A9P9ARS6_9HYPO|nr:acetolactate synthase [Thelonectria olida]
MSQISGAAAILYALEEAGITHLFVNLGSDHPAFLAAFASKEHNIEVFTSPNEMNALSAASGFAQITGKPAGVLVHVECGTQGLAGAVHNVSKGRIPVVILAGTVPVTMEGELRGSRNEYIHWIQDVPDQRSILKMYMKYDHEIRCPHNATQIVLRALQFANTEPKGPTYLIASRETLEADTVAANKASQVTGLNSAVESIGLSSAGVEHLANALVEAEMPLIVTSYCGRSPAGFNALKALAELLAIPVHENAPIYNNFPTDSYLHQGHQWNGGGQLPALAEADVVLVIDSDVPWIGASSRPQDHARVFHLDSDPLKDSTTLWSLPCEKRWRVDSSLALQQLHSFIVDSLSVDAAKVEARAGHLRGRYSQRTARFREAERFPKEGVTVPFVMERLRRACAGMSVVGLNESTTNLGNVADHLGHNTPLALIGSGGGSLGWYSGAAIGAFMGLQTQGRDDMLIAFTGDGTWLFGVPSCAYWMAKRYNTPFLTIIWNNGGWASPKNACLRLHGELAGQKNLSNDLRVALTPSPSFGKIAEGAGDAWWAVMEQADQVDGLLKEAIRVVRQDKRCALLEVKLNVI